MTNLGGTRLANKQRRVTVKTLMTSADRLVALLWYPKGILPNQQSISQRRPEQTSFPQRA